MVATWPLLAFCLSEIIGALGSFSFVSSCQWMYGTPCNDAETVYQNYDALWKLHVAILFPGILWASKDARLPTLIATLCSLGNFLGLIMFGAKLVHGLMTNSFHLLAMIVCFVLFVALLVSLLTMFTENSGTSSNRVSAKLFSTKKKGYLTVVGFYFILWLFVNSDGSLCTDVILNDSDMSPLATALWNFWSIGALQNALMVILVVLAGDSRQQTALCCAMTVVQIPAIFVAHIVKPITTDQIYFMTNTSFIVMGLFGAWALSAKPKMP